MGDRFEYATALQEKDSGILWDFYPGDNEQGLSLAGAQKVRREWQEEEGEDLYNRCVIVRRTPPKPPGEWVVVPDSK